MMYRSLMFRQLCRQPWFSAAKQAAVAAACDPPHVPAWRHSHRMLINASALLLFTRNLAARQQQVCVCMCAHETRRASAHHRV